jgi:cholesterol oxidase
MQRPPPATATAPQAAWPAPRPLFTERARPGIRFSEILSGHFVWIDGAEKPRRPEDDIRPWVAAATRADAATMVLDATIQADDVERFVSEWTHEARLIGTVTAPTLSETPMVVQEGRFALFVVDPERVETRYMRYTMRLTSSGGRTYRVEGTKVIRKASWRTLWTALTTLYITVHEHPPGRVGRGTLRVSAGEFVRRLPSMQATDTRGFAEALDVRARLIGFFLEVVRSMYGGMLARAVIATVDAPPWRRRPLPLTGERYEVPTSDTTRVHLTRYRGGDRGPVMLSPGFSVSAASFAADTIPQNLVECLLRDGYDVWLFDYRASSSFPAAATSFSIDDVALRDYPAAVDRIRRETGAADIQIVAHCVGALSLLMSLLGGKLRGEVRSIICSQLGLHPIAPRFAELKASLSLAPLLWRLGFATVSADFNPYWLRHRLGDKLLTLVPTDQPCSNPVCRRILLLLGESFRHAQLNTATHDTIADWFGTASLPALAHLSLMLQARKVLDRDGRDVYLRDPRALERLRIPITFLHGTLNREFLPRSTRETYKALCRVNGPDLYRRLLFRGYAHMDCFIGKRAAIDVFPHIISELEEAPGRRGRW